MNRKQYTFDGPPKLPEGVKTNVMPTVFIGVEEVQPGVFELVKRPIETGRIVQNRTTRKKGYLVRMVTTPIKDIAEHREVTITTEEMIIVYRENGRAVVHENWDTDDWQIEP